MVLPQPGGHITGHDLKATLFSNEYKYSRLSPRCVLGKILRSKTIFAPSLLVTAAYEAYFFNSRPFQVLRKALSMQVSFEPSFKDSSGASTSFAHILIPVIIASHRSIWVTIDWMAEVFQHNRVIFTNLSFNSGQTSADFSLYPVILLIVVPDRSQPIWSLWRRILTICLSLPLFNPGNGIKVHAHLFRIRMVIASSEHWIGKQWLLPLY